VSNSPQLGRFETELKSQSPAGLQGLPIRGAWVKAVRAKPITVPTTFSFPRGRLEGELTILPSYGQDSHPLHGHFYDGENAHPFIGRLTNLRIEAPTPHAGRRANTARDMAAYLAYESMHTRATKDMGERNGSAFATKQCLELWSRWPGIQDDRALRRAREKAKNRLKGTASGLLSYSGTKPDMSDYVVILLLAGAKVEVIAGQLTATGSAWIWRWGQQLAEHHPRAHITAQVPQARSFSWTVN
jgi:hypothetical protein